MCLLFYKILSASGVQRPLTPTRGIPPDPTYRLALRACHDSSLCHVAKFSYMKLWVYRLFQYNRPTTHALELGTLTQSANCINKCSDYDVDSLFR